MPHTLSQLVVLVGEAVEEVDMVVVEEVDMVVVVEEVDMVGVEGVDMVGVEEGLEEEEEGIEEEEEGIEEEAEEEEVFLVMEIGFVQILGMFSDELLIYYEL